MRVNKDFDFFCVELSLDDYHHFGICWFYYASVFVFVEFSLLNEVFHSNFVEVVYF